MTDINWPSFIDNEQVLRTSDEEFAELITLYEPNTLTIRGNCLLIQLAEHPVGNFNKFEKLIECESVTLDRGKVVKINDTVTTKNIIDILADNVCDDSINMARLTVMNTNLFDDMLAKTDFKNTLFRGVMLDAIKYRCKHNIKLSRRRSSNINILRSPQLSPRIRIEPRRLETSPSVSPLLPRLSSSLKMGPNIHGVPPLDLRALHNPDLTASPRRQFVRSTSLISPKSMNNYIASKGQSSPKQSHSPRPMIPKRFKETVEEDRVILDNKDELRDSPPLLKQLFEMNQTQSQTQTQTQTK